MAWVLVKNSSPQLVPFNQGSTSTCRKTRGICYNLPERSIAPLEVHGGFQRIEMVLALRTFFTRTDVLESLYSRKGATFAARNTLENRLIGQTDAGKRVVGSCQASAVAEHLSREPQYARVSVHLGRTRSTAQMIARQHALPVQEGCPWSHEQ